MKLVKAKYTLIGGIIGVFEVTAQAPKSLLSALCRYRKIAIFYFQGTSPQPAKFDQSSKIEICPPKIFFTLKEFRPDCNSIIKIK